jgi:hypothetical protein
MGTALSLLKLSGMKTYLLAGAAEAIHVYATAVSETGVTPESLVVGLVLAVPAALRAGISKVALLLSDH